MTMVRCGGFGALLLFAIGGSAQAEAGICKVASHRYMDCALARTANIRTIRVLPPAPVSDPETADKLAEAAVVRQNQLKAQQVGEGLARLEDAVKAARHSLHHRKQEFSEDAQIPEIVVSGTKRYRNFQRFMDKMEARENAVKLAEAELAQAAGDLNVALERHARSPRCISPLPDTDQYNWARQYWQDIRKDVAQISGSRT